MPKGIYKRTEKNKKTIRGWAKGGYHHTEETRNRISASLKGRKKPLFTEEHRRNIGKTSKGRRFSDESKAKHSITERRLYAEGKFKGSRGSNWKKESIEKISGKNSRLWQGGKSFEPYTLDWTTTLRRSIRERDKYTCQLCGELQSDVAFDVHHIDYDKRNCNSNNLITLCRSCHMKTNFNREYLKEYFSWKL